MNAMTLGEDYKLSLDLINWTVINQKTRLFLLKNLVSTHEDRKAYRLGNAHAEGIMSRMWSAISHKTDYAVVWQDLWVSRCAHMSYLVDASDKRVKQHFPDLQSYQVIQNPHDRLWYPNHKLLIEEHIYCFAFNPSRHTGWYVLVGMVEVGKLAAAIAGTVASIGAAAPALLASLRSAGNLVGDLVEVASKVDKYAQNLADGAAACKQAYDKFAKTGAMNTFSDIGNAISGAIGTGAGASALKDIKENMAQVASFGSNMSASVGSAPLGIGAVDFSAGQKSTADRKWKTGWFSSGFETEEEARARVYIEVVEELKRRSQLMFVVVQQATPIVMTNEDVDVVGQNIECKRRTKISTKSVVRIGHCDRDKYMALIKLDKSSAEFGGLFLNPWLVEKDAGYAEYVRGENVTAVAELVGGSSQKFEPDWSSSEHWDRSAPTETATIALPPGVLSARAKLNAKMQQLAADQARRKQERQKISLALASVTQHREAEKLRSAAAAREHQLRDAAAVREQQLRAAAAARDHQQRVGLHRSVAESAAMGAQVRAERMARIAEVERLSAENKRVATERDQASAAQMRANSERDRAAAAQKKIDEARQRSQQLIRILGQAKMLTQEEFIEATQIKKALGLFNAKRDNPNLLQVDEALRKFHQAKQTIFGLEPDRQVEVLVERLSEIIFSCEIYIEEKTRKMAGGGNESERFRPVQNLMASAQSLLNTINS